MMLRYRIWLSFFLLIIFYLSQPQIVTGQSQEKIYSVFIQTFIKGIHWPGSTTDNFVIGVLGYPPLAAELSQTFATTKIKNRSIEIREYASAEDIGVCQMIFVPAFKARSFEKVLAKVGTKPTLILSNKMDMAKKGAGVNFILIEGKLKFEINCKTIEQRGLKISSNIKTMGILVE